MANNDNNKLHTFSTCTASALGLQRKLLESRGRCTALPRRYLWGCYGAWDVPIILTIRTSRFPGPQKTKDLRHFKRGSAFSSNTNDQVCIVISFELWALFLLADCFTHFNMERQNWKSPSNSVKWSRELLALWLI